MRFKGYLLPLFFLVILSLSCSKTNLRAVNYTFDPYDFSGVTATMRVEESVENTFVTITTEIKGLTPGKTYSSFIYAGEYQKAGAILYNFEKILTTKTTFTKEIKMNMSYEDFTVWDASYAIHNPNDDTRFVLKGNLGINHKK